MTSDFFLVRWKAEGLRCPDHEIRLNQGKEIPEGVTLIQMPNGTGKTTTLTLLRAALSGDATEWNAKRVRSIQKKGGVATTGRFLVEGLFDGRRLTIVLELDFEEGKATYSTTFGQGKRIGFHPPTGLSRFLRPDFVRLFVFDGEEAERLLGQQHTNADDAIDSLFQLKFFDGIEQRITEYWEGRVNQVKSVDEKALTRRKNRVELLKKRLAACQHLYGAACSERDALQDQFDRNTRKFKQQIADQKRFEESLRLTEKALEDAKSQVQQQAQHVLGQMRDPFALSAATAARILELRANLDRVKLPESTAREFFDELAQEDECVCGRPLDELCKKHIQAKASRYLGSDDVALLNAMKGDIGVLIGDKPNEHADQLTGAIRLLRNGIRVENSARTERDAVENQAIKGNPKLEKITEELASLKKALEDATRKAAKYESTDESAGDETVSGVAVIEKRLKDAEKKLAEITETLDLRAKRDVLISVVRLAKERARSAIGEQTVLEANQRIGTLMPSNQIRIRGIDRCLVLEGQEGGSMGETLSVAYAFLATFFNSASNRFPFIVDSPAGPIDLGIRPRIAELVPKLTAQFIAFTISTERQGFSERFAKSADTNFLTLFRKGDAQTDKQAKAIKGTVETADGLLVPGYKFFQQFQLDSELG